MSIPRFWRHNKSRYNLIGTRCVKCDETYFPPRKLCPKCRRKGELEDVNLKRTGEIATFTVIRNPSEGWGNTDPYIMAIVKLDDGPSLTTQIVDCELEGIEIGQRVTKVFRKIQEDGDSGLIHYGFKFKPLD